MKASLVASLSADYVEALKSRIKSGSREDHNGCWIWQRSTKGGYGQTSVKNRPTHTHRLSYELFVGPVPDGMEICHRCDVRRCNNPSHLFAGTRADNVTDMWGKGRGKNPPVICGEAHPKATLSNSDVARVRRLARKGIKQREIAATVGCSQSTVWRIVHNKVRVHP